MHSSVLSPLPNLSRTPNRKQGACLVEESSGHIVLRTRTDTAEIGFAGVVAPAIARDIRFRFN